MKDKRFAIWFATHWGPQVVETEAEDPREAYVLETNWTFSDIAEDDFEEKEKGIWYIGDDTVFDLEIDGMEEKIRNDLKEFWLDGDGCGGTISIEEFIEEYDPLGEFAYLFEPGWSHFWEYNNK